MSDFEVGQVIALKIKFNNTGLVAEKAHPYLIIDVNDDLHVIEIAQIDSLEGKEFKAARRSNKVIYRDNPVETVIDKDSYVQLDNHFTIEDGGYLLKYRRQKDTLSPVKLQDVLISYRNYHARHQIDENKQVFMTKEEIENLNA